MNFLCKYNKIVTPIAISVALLFFVSGCKSTEQQESDPTKITIEGEMTAELTAPPLVPKPIGDRKATKLIVNMEILEKEIILAEKLDILRKEYKKLNNINLDELRELI